MATHSDTIYSIAWRCLHFKVFSRWIKKYNTRVHQKIQNSIVKIPCPWETHGDLSHDSHAPPCGAPWWWNDCMDTGGSPDLRSGASLMSNEEFLLDLTRRLFLICTHRCVLFPAHHFKFQFVSWAVYELIFFSPFLPGYLHFSRVQITTSRYKWYISRHFTGELSNVTIWVHIYYIEYSSTYIGKYHLHVR